MDGNAFWKGRMNELAMRAKSRHITTQTNFLSVSEQNEALKSLCIPASETYSYLYRGVTFIAEGGYDEAERRCFYFLAGEEDESQCRERLRHNGEIACIRFFPKSRHYAESLTHRDVLGCLMNLGIERDEFGDILFDEDNVYVMAINRVAQEILQNVTTIRHTAVESELLTPDECHARLKFTEEKITIASPRIDCILAEVYSLSREDAQSLIREGHVFVNGDDCLSPSKEVTAKARISVQGKGKFYFLGVEKTTRKGRLIANVRRFAS